MVILQDNTTNAILGIFDDGKTEITVTHDENLIQNHHGDQFPELEFTETL